MQRRVQALEKQLVEEAERLGQEATKRQQLYKTQAETALQNLQKECDQRLVEQSDRLALVRTPT